MRNLPWAGTGPWVLLYSHERRAIRNFRLDRMEGLTLTKERFVRPPGFSTPRGDQGEPRPLVVRALFDHEEARWVREARLHYKVAEAETPEGLLVTLQVRQESEVLAWLLGWGARRAPPTAASTCSAQIEVDPAR